MFTSAQAAWVDGVSSQTTIKLDSARKCRNLFPQNPMLHRYSKHKHSMRFWGFFFQMFRQLLGMAQDLGLERQTAFILKKPQVHT